MKGLRKIVCRLMLMSLLHGAMAPEVMAWSGARSLGDGVSAGQSESRTKLVAGLREVLTRALSQAEDREALTTMQQELEVIAVDLDSPHPQSAAARMLLRSIEDTAALLALKTFVYRNADQASAAELLGLLHRWQDLLADPQTRSLLAGGLFGLNDLLASFEVPSQDDGSCLNPPLPLPSLPQAFALIPIANTLVGEVIVSLTVPPPKGALFVHSGVSPPARAPPTETLSRLLPASSLPARSLPRSKTVPFPSFFAPGASPASGRFDFRSRKTEKIRGRHAAAALIGEMPC